MRVSFAPNSLRVQLRRMSARQSIQSNNEPTYGIYRNKVDALKRIMDNPNVRGREDKDEWAEDYRRLEVDPIFFQFFTALSRNGDWQEYSPSYHLMREHPSERDPSRIAHRRDM